MTTQETASVRGVRKVQEGNKLFATVPEAAAVLRSDVRSVRRSIVAGDIPATRVGPRWLVPVTWLRRAAGLEPGEAGP